jgi:hypothetical protein
MASVAVLAASASVVDEWTRRHRRDGGLRQLASKRAARNWLLTIWR